jgi:hypothetical protein
MWLVCGVQGVREEESERNDKNFNIANLSVGGNLRED